MKNWIVWGLLLGAGWAGSFAVARSFERGRRAATKAALCRVAEYSYECAQHGIALSNVTNNVRLCDWGESRWSASK